MRLTDLNPHGGIGANCWYVELGPFHLVIDCGISPKHEGLEAIPRLDKLRGRPVDLVLLTHCHLDHLGCLPVLMREHPDAFVVMSQASKLLMRRMLHNSCNVMIRQKEEHGIDAYPLYLHSEIERLAGRIFPVNFDHPRFFYSDDGDRLAVTYHHAGHIAGAAGVTLEYRHRRIFFTGDVLFKDQRILPGARFPEEKVDTLVMETTRGATGRQLETSRQTEVQRLVEQIRTTTDAGGSVLIPVFALGRMQELIAVLHDARARRDLRDLPIYASGLGIDLVDYFDEIARKTGSLNFRRSLLKDLRVQKLPDNHKPSRPKSNKAARPALYLLSSGMMVENTPSYAICSELLGNHRNAICFVGYCDPDTPGGRLLASRHGDPFLFEALDRVVPIEAHIEKFDLSSHADREELADYALSVEPRAVVLTHGDADARAWFRSTFAERAPALEVRDPTPLQAVFV